MKLNSEWITLQEPHSDKFPDPIELRVQNLAARHIFPMHTHEWHQLIYSISGTFLVGLEDSWHVVTPNHAIWVPIGCRHTSGTQNGAEFRNLYVADTPNNKVPMSCTVFTVSRLMRELIIELEGLDLEGADKQYSSKITDLILQQLQRLPSHDFSLPWPKSSMLRKYCEAMIENPADERSIDDWGALLGASTRTLTRKFEAEIGLTIRQWKRKLKAFLALDMLSNNKSITEISIDLGYSSVSAFTFMFREETGHSPSDWKKINVK